MRYPSIHINGQFTDTRPLKSTKALVVEFKSPTRRDATTIGDTVFSLAELGSYSAPISRSLTASVRYSAYESAYISLIATSASPKQADFQVLMHSDTVNLVK